MYLDIGASTLQQLHVEVHKCYWVYIQLWYIPYAL